MRALYKYIYDFSPDFMEEHNGSVFTVEEYQVLEDRDYPSEEEMTGWEKEYYMFVGKDDGIRKDSIDDWECLNYHDHGRHAWSFTNSEEKMKKFQNIIRDLETENLFDTIERTNRIKARLENVIKSSVKGEK